jgi:5-(carboxyamino)imidazole ribonucleotide synthase
LQFVSFRVHRLAFSVLFDYSPPSMHSATHPILPGATIGVLGSGQLGRMFTIAARQMGYRVHTYSPDNDTPTGQVADVEITAAYEDLDAVRDFAAHVSVVTFEFENVPANTAAACAERALVRPRGDVLHTTQHRLREKAFLSENGFPVTPFRPVRSQADLDAAIVALRTPAVLKSASFGYDGKGQTKIKSPADAAAALGNDPTQERVLEAFVDFECEVSVVAARSASGDFAHWGAINNTHVNHILDLSVSPADLPPKLVDQAISIARGILEKLDVIGVLCVEFFVTRGGKLLINELAPRPHNSGHFTIDACVTSQFQQQLRAVCGLPLGSTRQLRPAAMAQILGDQWQAGEPNWSAALATSGVSLHLYGKSDPRPGRKMGHLTAVADTPAEAAQAVLAARAALHDPA